MEKNGYVNYGYEKGVFLLVINKDSIFRNMDESILISFGKDKPSPIEVMGVLSEYQDSYCHVCNVDFDGIWIEVNEVISTFGGFESFGL